MGRDRHADAVRELHHPLLLQIGQAHVALDQIVLQHFRALQLHLELADARDGDAHLVVDAVPLHQVAGAVDARTRPHAGLVGFAIFDRFVRRVAGAAHGGDAEREPRAALRVAEVLLQMRMEFGQARHHRQVRRVDDFGLGWLAAACGTTEVILLPVDDDVDVRSQRRRLHVEQLAGVDDDARLRDRRRPRQIERHRLRSRRSRCRRCAADRATDRGCAANRPASSASARSPT